MNVVVETKELGEIDMGPEREWIHLTSRVYFPKSYCGELLSDIGIPFYEGAPDPICPDCLRMHYKIHGRAA